MLINTRATFDKIHGDFKRFVHICTLATPIFSIIYMIYAVIKDAGYLWVNVTLGVLSAAYIVFYSLTYDKKDKSTAKLKKGTKRAYKYVKLLLKAYTVGMTIYGIYIATANPGTLSVLLAVVNLVAWAFQVLVELALLVFERYKDLLFAAIAADFEVVTKPARAVGDFVKKVVTGEPEPAAEPVKKNKTLENIVAKFKDKKQKEKDKKAKEKAAAEATKTAQ